MMMKTFRFNQKISELNKVEVKLQEEQEQEFYFICSDIKQFGLRNFIIFGVKTWLISMQQKLLSN